MSGATGAALVSYTLFQLSILPLVLTTSSPLSTKRPTIFTASLRRPPPFPLKSRTILWAPLLDFKLIKAERTLILDVLVKLVSFIYPSVSFIIPKYGTSFILICALVSRTSFCSLALLYAMVREVPTFPLSRPSN